MSNKLMEQPWLWNRFFDDSIETYVGAKNEPVLDYRVLEQPRLRIMDGQNAGGVQMGDYGDDLAYVQTPQIISPLNGASDVNPTPMFTGSAFLGRLEGGAPDTHAASYWEIATDPQFGTLVHTSGRVTDSLTVYDLAAVPLTFEPETQIYVRVKYESATGLVSAWSPTLAVITRSAWLTYFDTTAVIGGTTTEWLTSYSTTVAAQYASTSHVTSWEATYRSTSLATSHNTSGSNNTSQTTQWGTQYASTSYVTNYSGSFLTAKSTSHSTTKTRTTASGSRTTSRSTTKSRTTATSGSQFTSHSTNTSVSGSWNTSHNTMVPGYISWDVSESGTTHWYTRYTRMSTSYSTSGTVNRSTTTGYFTATSGSRSTDYSATTQWSTSGSQSTSYSAQTYYNTNKSTSGTQSRTTSRSTAINPGYSKTTNWTTSFNGITNYNTTFDTQVGGAGSRTTTYDTLMAAASSHITEHNTSVQLDIGSTTYATNYITEWEADIRTTSHVTEFVAEAATTSHLTQSPGGYRIELNPAATRMHDLAADYGSSFSIGSEIYVYETINQTIFDIRDYPAAVIRVTSSDDPAAVVVYEGQNPFGLVLVQAGQVAMAHPSTQLNVYEEPSHRFSNVSFDLDNAGALMDDWISLKPISTSKLTEYSTEISAGGSRTTNYQTEYEAAGSRSTSHDTTQVVDAQTTTYETSRNTN